MPGGLAVLGWLVLRPCGCCASPLPPAQMDTEGSEVHINDLPGPIKAEKGQEFTFTVRAPAQCTGDCFSVRWGRPLVTVRLGLLLLERLHGGPAATAWWD